MTALNLIVRPAGAYLLADRAGCTADGILQSIESKIVVSSRLRLAIAHTGVSTPDFMDCKRAWLVRQVNQTEALSALPSLLRELVALNDVALCEPGARQAIEGMPYVVTLAVAMWSTVFDRAGGCVLTSGRGHLPDRVPEFQLWPTRQYIQPEVPAELHPGAAWHLERDGVAFVEAQRRLPSPWGASHIGGGVDLAVVDAAGAYIQGLHTWPDRVGETIAV
ncbi:hypothetical protein [Novosphingobium sp. Fuku2-ISO-50]|uniref:hypothetical protein n=1 Tax=Novosphingobium sp. Fuku2-ISO-50 TaxID=1739114 RepID=UPI00076D551B|nr:hypothetical protein [Novosphingobium sp. Fuku2-ISO-50]KUR77245.1 hypothetical protein AQZ50_10470 [Novosphingobium sp. Fuku2-ISO-50]